jgi:uncharacterized protein
MIRRILLLPVLLALGLFWTGLYGLLEARSDPVVRRATITVERLPASTPPLRLALVSDIHVGNAAMTVGRLERIVDMVNAQHADAVLLAGDFVNGYAPNGPEFAPDLLVAPLSRLRAPLGVFASLGNHDTGTDPQRVTATLNRAGIRVLDDDAVRLGPIALLGTTFVNKPLHDELPAMKAVRAMGGVPVMMTHVPPFPGIVPNDVPLLLSGHTHCGQILFRLGTHTFEPTQTPQRFDPAFRCGLAHAHTYGRTYTILISAGVGASSDLPIRIGAPPDFWVVTLTGRRTEPSISAASPAPRQTPLH